jgi:hypothetical protein
LLVFHRQKAEGKLMSNDRAPAIVALEIWEEYKPQADGSMKTEERIKWVRRGAIGAETSESVHRLKRDNSPIWQALEPAYDAWKKGKTAPIDGTPLAAWPGATPQLVKALEPYHIRSIEDLANIEDGVMARTGVPGMRAFKANAMAYIDAQKTTSVVAGEISVLRGEKEAMQAEIAELKELVQSLAAEQGVRVTDDNKRPVGRPRKVA